MAEQRVREFEAYYGLSEEAIAEAAEERLAKIARFQTTGAHRLWRRPAVSTSTGESCDDR